MAEDVQDSLAEVGEQVEMIDEDLESLENDYYDYDEDEDDDDCCCDDCCCDDDECYEVQCPACGETIHIPGSIVDEGEMDCPACGEHLEFDFDDEDEEDKEE